jgi:Peptidase MA superfamily
MTHELTHQVIFQMTSSPYNDLPVWLNEGLAMFAEGPLSAAYASQLNSALKNGSVFTVRTLASPFSAFSDKANLSYAESYSFVDYLVDTYGSAKMLQLLETFHKGSDFDPAFHSVFGLDMDGLYAQWKTWAAGRYGS